MIDRLYSDAAGPLVAAVRFVLRQPGVIEAIGERLAEVRNAPYVLSRFEDVLAALDDWPDHPKATSQSTAGSSALSAGEALAALADAGGDLPASELPLSPETVEALRNRGLIANLSPRAAQFELSLDGWVWCEREADLETRIRAVYRSIRLDGLDPLDVFVPLDEMRAELSRHRRIDPTELDAVLAAMARIPGVTISDNAEVVGSEAGAAPPAPAPALAIERGAARATSAADPLITANANRPAPAVGTRNRLAAYTDASEQKGRSIHESADPEKERFR